MKPYTGKIDAEKLCEALRADKKNLLDATTNPHADYLIRNIYELVFMEIGIAEAREAKHD